MKFIILSLLITQFFAVNCLSQTRITTKSGIVFIGFIQSDNGFEIEMLSLNDEKIIIPNNTVFRQELLNLSISTKSGLELNGTLVRMGSDDFDLRTEDGIMMTIRFDGVEKFKIEDREFKRIFNTKLKASINKSELKNQNYYETNRVKHPDFVSKNSSTYQKFGVNIGTPAGINLAYGYTNQIFGFHLSAGFWKEDLVGFQIGPSLNLGMNEVSELNLVVAYGIMHISSYHYESINFLLDAYIYGLHFEVGLGLGDGNVRSPQLLFQVGLAFRWD